MTLVLDDFIFSYTKRAQAFRLCVERFEIRRGEVVFLHGPSGCGKTTLLNLLSGVVRSSVVLRSRAVFGRIGYIMHDVTLLPWLTVEQNLAAEARLRAIESSVVEFVTLAARFRLPEDCLRMRPRALSHGMRQRVEIAKALSFRPGLLLLDEGLAGIDVRTRRIVMRELANLVAQDGLTVVGTAHHAADILSFAHRVYLLDDGRVRFGTELSGSIEARLDMSPEELFRVDGAGLLLA